MLSHDDRLEREGVLIVIGRMHSCVNTENILETDFISYALQGF